MSNSRPNILILYTDQQRWDALGVNGNADIKTPNLDRLAREGAASQAQNRGFAENADQMLNNPRLLLIRGSPCQPGPLNGKEPGLIFSLAAFASWREVFVVAGSYTMA
jgi:hypothetical protein